MATVNRVMVDPGAAFRGDQGASNLLGKLYRAQWNDWKARFAPYVDRLADKATDPGFLTEQADMAAASVTNAYGTARQGLDMQRQGMGLSQTPQQQQAEQRKMAVAESADTNTAYNQARISARDLQDQILAGGMGLDNMPATGQQ